jgi:hypothetical protein
MGFNIDQSDPYIESVDIPGEARPNESFTVTATVGNRSETTIPQDGTCQSGIVGTNVAWKTPVVFRADGRKVAEVTKCLDGSSGTKSVSRQVTLGPGEHTVTVEVIKAPGGQIADTRGSNVSVSEDARDPSIPSTGDRMTQFLGRIADSLGGTTQQVAFGMVLAVILLVVI